MLETLREHFFAVYLVIAVALAASNYLDGNTFQAVVWGIAAAIAASLVWYTYFYDDPDEERTGEGDSNGETEST